MAEGEDQKREYYIRLLSFITGPALETLHLYFEMKVLNTLDFFSFLEKHKHVLFHELNPSTRCCECQKVHIAAAKKKGHLIDTQFYLMFEKDEGREIQGHKRTQGHQIRQFCLCSFSAKRVTTVEMMDITLLSVVINSCCPPGSISGHPSWIKDIKTRNFLAHCPSCKITKTEFDQMFTLTEQSVLNLASVVGYTCHKLIKSQISYFQKSELSTVRDIIKNSNDSIRQILGMFVEEQTTTFESIADQTRNLSDNTDALKTEVLTQLQEQKRISVGIRNIVFEVKTVLQSQQEKSTDSSEKIVSHDDDVCYVEWKLETPGSWNIDAIKGTLENFSTLMGNFFRIVFVYKGSLVIQTTAPKRFLQNEEDFRLAIKLFLRDLVDIGKIDSETKTIVKVEVVLSPETFTSQMASSEDSNDSAEDGPEYNAIIQPPLIKQLKKILDEYPDDGQILKEIIQNAEDAEASQMKIMFDERPVNSELDDGIKEKKFKKYFKGPALCVYNNANFTEDDWKGLQMINSSVKELDPVKIGQFGLGFKYVFHITDYPMIISGNRMLVIDPHKSADRVCINMKLNKLHKYKKHLHISYCLNALDGLFDFSQKTLDSGNFNGTLFRFPLRYEKTNLSDNVYDKEKISDLFNAFKAEASVELLFLNCIEKIKLYEKDGYKLHKSDKPPFFTVKIAESCLDEVRTKRSEFHTHMQSVGRKIAEQTFSTKVDVKIETQAGSGNKSEQSWFVLHCLKGGNLSQELATLSLDVSLSNSPYVSIAVPKDIDADFKGHVFCLMPLPLEDKSSTGYPVHVNGHFALSQNRRHVKWPTADQVRNKAHIDKSIRWNNCLLVEVLAGVYHEVIQDLLQTCKANGNTKEDLDRLYRSIPDHRKVTSHWDLICEPFFQTFLQTACLFSDSLGGKWIRPKGAVFKIFDTNVTEVIQETICRLMQACCIGLVDVPDHIVAVLKHRKYSVQTMSQEFIRTCLTSDTSYKSFSCEEKFNILSFLVSDGNYSKLSGLELLPLDNGSFCTFNNNKNNRVFICKDDVALSPGQEERFIKKGLNDEIYNHLFMMASNGLYQVVILQDQSANTQKDERPLDDILKDVKEKIKAAWTLPEDERKKIIRRFFKKWHPDKNHGNEKIATEVYKFIKNLILQMENGEDVDANTNSNFKHPPRNSTFWEHFRTLERDTTEDKNYSEQRSQSSSGCGTSSGRGQHKQEVPLGAEAGQWMRQAKLDFTAAKQFLPSAETGPHFNWICIMCYQSVEKVLKALHCHKDCNDVPSTNDLLQLSASLDQNLQVIVQTLVDVIGPRERTMYPDRMDIPKVPADAFNKQTAKSSVNITEEILEFSTARL